MKSIMKISMVLICLAMLFGCKAQAPSAKSNSYEGWPAKWYAFDNQGELSSFNILENMIVSKEERKPIDEFDVIRTDTITIEKRLDEKHLIISNQHMEGAALMYIQKVNANVLNISTSIEGNSVEEVLKQYKDEGLPIWKDMMGRHVYSEQMIGKLKERPGLDEINKEDLLASLDWRAALQKPLEAFINEKGSAPSYMIRRIVKNYRNKKFVLLGYNPYKEVEYNFEKQFENDPEVIELLNQPVRFD